jgi:hypothetical protein
MKHLYFLLLLLHPLFSLSGNTYKGKLLDSQRNPIPYANIVIYDTAIGTMSNIEGEFNITIPPKYIKCSLVFSALGFKTKVIPISKFTDIIVLETNVVKLEEVTVKIKATNANQIVKKAFDLYEQNFPTSPFIGKAFLRHTEKTKTKYKWLIDAAIEVYDPGFNKSPEEIQINVKEIRRSFDNRNLDTVFFFSAYLREVKGISYKKALRREKHISREDPKEIQKAIQYMDNRKSNPRTLFSGRVNVIRQYKQKDAIFDGRILAKHNFKIDTVLRYNSDDIYKIKITPKSPIAKLNRHYEDFVFPIGWIYIRAKDYAIFELQYSLINSKKAQWRTNDTRTKLHYSLNIKYIEINHKMYPKHITLDCPKVNKPSTVFNNEHEGIKINPEDFYYETQEITFNEIITDKTILSKALQKHWDSNLFTPRPYNPEFWENYSDMVETKEQKKFRERLESELSEKSNTRSKKQ